LGCIELTSPTSLVETDTADFLQVNSKWKMNLQVRDNKTPLLYMSVLVIYCSVQMA